MEKHCAWKIVAMGIFCFLLILPLTSFAQGAPVFVKAYQSLSDTTCSVGDIAVSAGQEVLLTGYLSGRMILGKQEYRVADNDATQMFVAKFDQAGDLAWLRTAGGSSFDEGTSIAMDSSGNSFVTGDFSGTAKFGGGTNESLAAASGVGKDMFIAKYSAGGGYLWAKKAGATQVSGQGQAYGLGVAVDGSGNSYVTGGFQGTVFPSALTSDFFDIYLAKYDNAGTLLWAKKAGGTGFDEGLAVAVDGSGVVLAGRFSGTSMFSASTLTSAGRYDAFVAKYNNVDGGLQWVKRFGGSGNEQVNGLRIGGDGKIYLTGAFNDSFQFAGKTMTCNGGSDIFVTVYSGATGAELLAIAKGGTGTDSGRDIVADGSGNFTVAGSFQGTVDLGGTTVTSKGGKDMFVASYNSAGTTLRFALSGGGSNDDSAQSAGLFDNDTLLVAGAFNGLATLGEQSLASVSKYGDMFASVIDQPSGLVPGIPGDFTGDKKVSLADVLGILRLLSGKAP